VYKIENFEKYFSNFVGTMMKPMMKDDLTECIDCIIHGLTAKNPHREYKPNWGVMGIFGLLPNFIVDYFFMAKLELNSKAIFTAY